MAAVGGYGRRRLAPYSDVDLALLHTGLKPDRVKTLTRELFYPLWDAQLKVSNTVRTIREAVSAAADIHWLTSSLDARFLGGDPEVFSAFVAKMRAVAGARGGRRDIQTVSWIVKAPAAAGAEAPLAPADKDDLAEAEEWLWQVRVGLQEISGKTSDTLLNDHRSALVDHLFSGRPDADRHFNRRFYGCTRAVAHISDAFFSELVKARPKTPSAADLSSTESLFSALRNADKSIEALEDLAYSGQLAALIPQWREIDGAGGGGRQPPLYKRAIS